MADKTTTNFPKMGTSNATAVNVSGAASPNTRFVPRKNTQGGGDPSVGTKSNRQGSLERNGFKGAPQVNHCYPNAPEAANVQRNVRIVQSAIGNRDFYLKRQYGQAAQ